MKELEFVLVLFCKIIKTIETIKTDNILFYIC